MFFFTNSLFSVYKQNVFFLHSSGVASHMVERILLDVQGLRACHFANNTELMVFFPFSFYFYFILLYFIKFYLLLSYLKNIKSTLLILLYRNNTKQISNNTPINYHLCTSSFIFFKRTNLEYLQTITRSQLLMFLLPLIWL